MPNYFFNNNKKGQELKNRTIDITYVTPHEQGQQKSRGFLECVISQLIGFFTVNWAIVFPSWLGYRQFYVAASIIIPRLCL